ncbi:NAD(P)/FAD-dependent oxidoreductase [Desulfovibrio sp. JC022]|uniref:NAD(P)/FAD-dependent oxidoreductase n=1 Tax=Desulfovibrio sp. JC022 TaxID=2593642 RepID=UPI0013D6E92E|nr:NAD(P)/FAD-dependent oxidoreductase [Desulfovibrio sp. JC022]NDV23512.1 NAD(P)/FAD-dependent oxidoreductase [Desulfovibrio sp. JC022]
MTETNYDIIILGAGPAGLQAAIHSARKGLKVLILGKNDKSSLWWAHIENFCCTLEISGEQILRTGQQQAESFGAVFFNEDVLKIKTPDLMDLSGGGFTVTSETKEFKTKAIIICTGTTRNKLGVPGEKDLFGKGVSYCVECDGNFFRGEEVAIVGGESAAAGGALHLSHLASKVHLVSNEFNFAPELMEKLKAADIIIHEGVEVDEITGGSGVDGLVFKDGNKLDVTGVFIELGAKGVMSLAAELGIQLDESMKFIETDKQQRTNVPGIFAAGDICGPPLQMAKAVGEGCVAGLSAAKYVRKA